MPTFLSRTYLSLFFLLQVFLLIGQPSSSISKEKADTLIQLMQTETNLLGRAFKKIGVQIGKHPEPNLTPYVNIMDHVFLDPKSAVWHKFESNTATTSHPYRDFCFLLMEENYSNIRIDWDINVQSIELGRMVTDNDGKMVFPEAKVVIEEVFNGYEGTTLVYSNSSNKTLTFRVWPDENKLRVTRINTAKFSEIKIRESAKNNDIDGDGIPDPLDSCPEVAGSAICRGCPANDSDNDGVADCNDLCPDTPGSPRDFGCPSEDTDGDGVNNDKDKCPDDPGPKENCGCPIGVVVTSELPTRFVTLIPSLGDYKLDATGKPYWLWAAGVIANYGLGGYHYYRYKKLSSDIDITPPPISDANGWQNYREAKQAKENALVFAGIGTGLWIASIIQSNKRFNKMKKDLGCSDMSGIFFGPPENYHLENGYVPVIGFYFDLE